MLSRYLVWQRTLEGVPRRRVRFGPQQHRDEVAHVAVLHHVGGDGVAVDGVVVLVRRRVVRRLVVVGVVRMVPTATVVERR